MAVFFGVHRAVAFAAATAAGCPDAGKSHTCRLWRGNPLLWFFRYFNTIRRTLLAARLRRPSRLYRQRQRKAPRRLRSWPCGAPQTGPAARQEQELRIVKRGEQGMLSATGKIVVWSRARR